MTLELSHSTQIHLIGTGGAAVLCQQADGSLMITVKLAPGATHVHLSPSEHRKLVSALADGIIGHGEAIQTVSGATPVVGRPERHKARWRRDEEMVAGNMLADHFNYESVGARIGRNPNSVRARHAAGRLPGAPPFNVVLVPGQLNFDEICGFSGSKLRL
jgi:hypothetical protein